MAANLEANADNGSQISSKGSSTISYNQNKSLQNSTTTTTQLMSSKKIETSNSLQIVESSTFINMENQLESTHKWDNNILIDGHYRQEVYLIDKSAHKKHVAYITRHFNSETPNSNTWYLTVSEFDTDGDILLGGYKKITSINVTSYLQDHLNKVSIFLSISVDGKIVCISFLDTSSTDEKKSKKDKSKLNGLVFKVTEDGSRIVYANEIKFQGPTFYTNDGRLIVMDQCDILVLDEKFRKNSKLCVKQYSLDFSAENELNAPYMTRTGPMTIKFDLHSSLGVGQTEEFMRISRLIKQGFVVADLDSKSHVWALFEPKTSTILRKKNETVIYVSPYKTFIASIVDCEHPMVNIYNYDLSLLSYSLKSQRSMAKNMKFHLPSIYFSKNLQHVVMIGIEETTNADQSVSRMINFEVWHVETGVSIFFHQKPMLHSNHINQILQPFVIETAVNDLPKFTAYYITYLENGNTKMEKLDIEIFKVKSTPQFNPNKVASVKELNLVQVFQQHQLDKTFGDENDSGWMFIDSHSAKKENETELSDINEISNNILEVFGLNCYIRRYNGCNYLLKLCAHMIQLWRISDDTSIDDGELLYIQVYKPMIYYKETYGVQTFWILDFDQKQPIQFLDEQGSISDRMLLRIKILDNGEVYMSEAAEIYIPFKQLVANNPLNQVNLNFVQHKMLTASQSLYYLSQVTNIPDYLQDHWDMLYTKSKEMIQEIIELNKKYKSIRKVFFTTVIGTNIMLPLCTCDDGKILLFELLQIENMPIASFGFYSTTSVPENILTVLIEQKCYDLFKLLFNRLIYTAKTLGFGHFSILEDAIMYLQDKGNSDLLTNSCAKLSYLQMDLNLLPLDEYERQRMLDDYLYSSNNFDGFSTFESLSKDHSIWYPFDLWEVISLSILAILTAIFIPIFLVIIIPIMILKAILNQKRKVNQTTVRQVTLCLVPLIKFATYQTASKNNDWNFFKHLIAMFTNDQQDSKFVEIATDQNDNNLFAQGEIFLEALLQNKWNNFINLSFYLMYCIFLLFYITFSVGVSFSKEVFKYETFEESITTNPGHQAVIALMFLTAFIIFMQELRQICKSESFFSYFSYFYNWIDIAALSLPITSFVLILKGDYHFDDVCTVATLFIWFQGILKLRVYPVVGIAVETLIQLVISIREILLILLLILCAFTNAFIVLLRNQPDEYFQGQYVGNFANATDDSTSFSMHDASSGNSFTNPLSALQTSWFILFGMWDGITSGDVGGNNLVIILAFLFSLITILIFFNFVIAYMNDSIEDVKQRGKKVWISHFAAGIAEVEQLWCRRRDKCDRLNNPAYTYYWAPMDACFEHEQKLADETDELIKRLNIMYCVEDENDYQPNKIEETIDRLEILLKSEDLSLLSGAIQGSPEYSRLDQAVKKRAEYLNIHLNLLKETLKASN